METSMDLGHVLFKDILIEEIFSAYNTSLNKFGLLDLCTHALKQKLHLPFG